MRPVSIASIASLGSAGAAARARLPLCAGILNALPGVCKGWADADLCECARAWSFRCFVPALIGEAPGAGIVTFAEAPEADLSDFKLFSGDLAKPLEADRAAAPA